MSVCSHILVVCEASAEGDEALVTAAALARRCGAQLTLLAVAEADPPSAHRCCGAGSAAWERCERDDARARLQRGALLASDGPEPELAVAEGYRNTVPAIVAEERGCDLIVVPAFARGRLARLTRRDWTVALRRRASVPVLQAPPTPARRPAPGAAAPA